MENLTDILISLCNNSIDFNSIKNNETGLQYFYRIIKNLNLTFALTRTVKNNSKYFSVCFIENIRK